MATYGIYLPPPNCLGGSRWNMVESHGFLLIKA